MLAFADTFLLLSNRISLFVNVPLERLDRLSLQTRIDAIGEHTKSAAQPT